MKIVEEEIFGLASCFIFDSRLRGTLPEKKNSSHLKMDGWKMKFLLSGVRVFGGRNC